jgi:hypothetical protein
LPCCSGPVAVSLPDGFSGVSPPIGKLTMERWLE